MTRRAADIIAAFKRLGIVKRGRVVARALANAKFGRLIDAAEDSAQLTSEVDHTFDQHLDNYCASVTLAGSHEHCSELECRLGKIDELSRYAALYAEHVVVHNLLSEYSPSLGHPPDRDGEWFRERLGNDLRVILKIAPLIDSGLIVPLTPVRTVCPACASALLFGSGADKRFRKAERELRRRFFDNTHVEFSYDPETQQYFLDCEGPEPLFDHSGTAWFNHKPREPLASMPRIMARVHEGETVPVSKTVRRKIAVHEDCADLRLELLSYQITTSQMLGTSLVTDQQLHAELLDSITDRTRQHSKGITPSNLDVVVPFAGDVPINQLLKLRQREEESFVTFRAALRSAAKEYSDADGQLSRRRANELYGDVVEPSLARLEKRVKRGKRDLVAGPLKSAAGTIAALAIGIYTGIIPAQLAAAAQSLGAAKIIHDSVVRAAESASAKDVADNQFYFLWKVKHAVRKPRHSKTKA